MSGEAERRHWDRRAATLSPEAAVIDPADRRGRKNAYIARLRDRAVLEALPPGIAGRVILDLGCGTGSLSRALLAGTEALLLGLDIAPGMLRAAGRREPGPRALFARYDGLRLPVADGGRRRDHHLRRPHARGRGGRAPRPARGMPAGARTRRADGRHRAGAAPRPAYRREEFKRYRTAEDYRRLFAEAGFRLREATVVRIGHAPWIYAVRFGLVPERCYARLAAWERRLGRKRALARRLRRSPLCARAAMNVPVIVGAGPAGLCLAARLRRRGFEPLLLEASEVGSTWRRSPPTMRVLSPWWTNVLAGARPRPPSPLREDHGIELCRVSRGLRAARGAPGGAGRQGRAAAPRGGGMGP
ncbi:MAG: methyltransferase domain-containing protein [Xanthomonadales bacterium]|nr:methyltransferase domain-containing protein [Xanthomonadales bacterium]